MQGKVLAFWLFLTGKIISSLPSLAINLRQAYGPSSPKPYTEELINPDSLQTCLLFPPSPAHPSQRAQCPSPSPGSPCTGSSSAPIYVLQLLLEQEEASAAPGSVCADHRSLSGLARLGTSQISLAIPTSSRGNLWIYRLHQALNFRATGIKSAVCEIFLVTKACQKI